ncbi:MAG: biliverdin-producing heme oxygenase [Chitinophagales bacterium]
MTPLKEATSEKHKLAERMPFNVRMFRGQLTKTQYALYLTQQHQIFSAIEAVGVPHPALCRVAATEQDIRELVEQGHHAGSVLPATQQYAQYLSTLNRDTILPHVYLNYLALIYGGQMMKKMVPSTGRMYEFEQMQEAVQAIRAVQQDAWADEVNKGFDFNIAIFDELEKACLATA